NYLARLGWSHGDDEVFSTEQMIEWFTLGGIGKSAARFDFAKLENLNGLYMRDTPDGELLDALVAVLPHVDGGPEMLSALAEPDNRAKLLLAMPGLKERAKTLIELQTSSQFLFARRPLAMEEKAAGLLDDGGREVMAGLLPALEKQSDWTVESLEQAVRDFATAQDLKLGKVAQPLRAALTGSTQSPPIFDVLAVLGREEALGRLKDL
ncbi:MAG: glutamate--tRNA ligase, partial [Anderseniella sp.]|nr:glutamate--tRNA ligase [Anderseniella sp.]